MKFSLVFTTILLSALSEVAFSAERILSVFCSQIVAPLAYPPEFYIDVISEDGKFTAYFNYEEENPSTRPNSSKDPCYTLPSGEFVCADFRCNPSEVECTPPYYSPMGVFKREKDGAMTFSLHRIYVCK